MSLSRAEIGQRLRDLREAIGFTQAEVASRLEMHRPTITEIEAGRRAVSSVELARFAALYATPIGYLLAETRPTADEAIAVLCRGIGADRPEAKLAIRQFVQECREERELEELLGLPSPDDLRPAYNAPPPRSHAEAIRQGEQIAEQERRRLDLGGEPVRNVLGLLQRQGVAIRLLPDGRLHDELDGFFLETSDGGACIAVNVKANDATGYRAAFTGAHEYAHWLLRDKQAELFQRHAPVDGEHLEVRANAFAAAFLMPRAGLQEYLSTQGLLGDDERSVPHLSPGDVVRGMNHFGVSRDALVFRLRNLEFISEEQKTRLREFVVSSTAAALGIGWRAHEREWEDRRCTLALRAWRSGAISASRAAALCDKDLTAFKRLVVNTGETPEPAADVAILGIAG